MAVIKYKDGTGTHELPLIVPMDTALSPTSTNGVQNSVVTAAINAKSTVSVAATGTATDEVQYITVNGVEKKLAGGTIPAFKILSSQILPGEDVTVELTNEQAAIVENDKFAIIQIDLTDLGFPVTYFKKFMVSNTLICLTSDNVGTSHSGIIYFKYTKSNKQMLARFYTYANQNEFDELEEDVGDLEDIVTEHTAQIAAKYTKPASGIPASDIATGVIPTVSVSSTGTATDEVGYITINGTEKKIAGGLHDGTTAGQALIWNGTEWKKQAGYGYETDETCTITDLTSGYIPSKSLTSSELPILKTLLNSSHLGQAITLIVNGTSYQTTIQTYNDGMVTYYYIGNQLPYYSNIPYLIALSEDSSIYTFSVYGALGTGPFNVKIVGIQTITISQNLIPHDSTKQDVLTAGAGIEISNNSIAAKAGRGLTFASGGSLEINGSASIGTSLGGKIGVIKADDSLTIVSTGDDQGLKVNTEVIQSKLTAGTNITIDANNEISANVGGDIIQDPTDPSSGQVTASTLADVDTTLTISGAAADAKVTGDAITQHSTEIANKYTKPASGIPKTDLASDVQTSLGKADTALQEHQSLANYYTKTETDTALANKINKNMTATATGLSAGASPTVSYNSATNVIAFGIPKGDTGATGASGSNGVDGDDGTTFTPSVSSSGVISWTNDGGKSNPPSVDIVQAVINAIGTPVIGTVDANNTISLSSNGLVEQGTYTVKYIKEDETEVTIGTLTFSSREWSDWYYYASGNTIGATYILPEDPQVASNQYPNKVCSGVAGDIITISADTSKLTKVDIIELNPCTITSTAVNGTIVNVTTVQASSFVNGQYTYTATNANCQGIAFRFKATSVADGRTLAASITFEG